MEPISAVALSLALGAGAVAGKEVVSALVKDAYTALKDLIRNRYPKVSIEQLEQAPESKNRRAVVEEDLSSSGAGQDTELATAARALIKLIEEQAPAAASAIGVDLQDVAAANLRLADIVAAALDQLVSAGRSEREIDLARSALATLESRLRFAHDHLRFERTHYGPQDWNLAK